MIGEHKLEAFCFETGTLGQVLVDWIEGSMLIGLAYGPIWNWLPPISFVSECERCYAMLPGRFLFIRNNVNVVD